MLSVIVSLNQVNPIYGDSNWDDVCISSYLVMENCDSISLDGFLHSNFRALFSIYLI